GGPSSLYAHGYWRDEDHPASAPSGRACWSTVVASMALVLLSTNGLHFLVAWEVFSIGVYFLITRERHKSEVRSAGWVFLVASRAGSLCLVAFFAGLAARTGSWELGPMHHRPDLAPWFWLALLGFGVKAGIFPLHIWLPSAHANAPSHVSALLSGVSIKMGIYGLVRFSGWLPTPDAAGWLVASLGAASAVLGVAFALGQHDLKRLLAYHSVENIGIILIGLGFAMIATLHHQDAWGRLAMAGCLLHVWNHGLFKALLFLGAGSVLHSTGTREMSRLGGLWRVMPWTAGTFAVGAVAIAGLPPLNGFVSEFLVYLGLFGAVSAHSPLSWTAAPAAILLCMTGALALACFVKAGGVVFLGQPRSEAAANAHENGWAMRVPMLMLSLACVAIGLAPVPTWSLLAPAIAAWQPAWKESAPPHSLVALAGFHLGVVVLCTLGVTVLWRVIRHNGLRHAPTWDCGYARPTTRMQYTAGSFAAIITSWFAWILRPRGHANRPTTIFPARASFEEHTPETVLEHVVEPGGTLVVRLAGAARRLQHGRIQAYVLYVLIGVAGLALLAVMGGAR
ncbi:MAG TPA: proton-conducting transporter membrane subunit, partial [Candidatus Krumholzibacteria bacterium]|nr:proton-conducting transporter membrane subunit [Candidatus Krumholzibacteria bacterium]